MTADNDFEARVEAAKKSLANSTVGALFEVAATAPGGPCDAPFAPIDPAFYAAAVRLVHESRLDQQFREFKLVRGM